MAFLIKNMRQVLQFRPAVQCLQPLRAAGSFEINALEENESTGLEKSVNKVTLLGRVGGDPQMRGSEGNSVVVFSLATHLNYKQSNGDLMQKTDWHRICVFRPSLRDIVYKFLRKGQRVYLTGRITYGEVKDENGSPRQTTAITAEEVVFLQENNKA